MNFMIFIIILKIIEVAYIATIIIKIYFIVIFIVAAIVVIIIIIINNNLTNYQGKLKFIVVKTNLFFLLN